MSTCEVSAQSQGEAGTPPSKLHPFLKAQFSPHATEKPCLVPMTLVMSA